MSVVSARPSHGLRLRLVLDKSKARYEGAATTPSQQWDVAVALEPDVAVETGAPKDVADYVKRVVRIAVRDAVAEGTSPPRTIQRWRAEKE